MQLTEQEIQALVEKVVGNLQQAGVSDTSTADLASVSPTAAKQITSGKAVSLGDGVFASVEEAVAAAVVAEAKMAETSLLTRKNMIKLMRETSLQHAEELAKLAVEETGLGRVSDKIGKNVLAAEKTPGVEDLVSTTYTGDDGLTLVEAAPIGVIGSITPVTNPGATIINNSISMVAAGNVVVYNPHPSAKYVSLYAMQLLNRAIVKAGGPANVLTAVAEPSLETSNQVMTHPAIRALVVTGGGAVVKAAMGVGKKVIAAGPGNPPCVVDETADIEKAGKDIVFGASFDNNVLCTAEKEIFVVDKVANALKSAMAKNNAMELKGFQLEKVLKVVLTEKNGRFYPNREFIGKDASVILEAAGLKADSSIRLLFAETKADHPLIFTEMLMPIIPVVRVPDVDTAIDFAIKAEKGNRHTATMHSQNVTNLTKMAQRIQATIFVKNGPSLSGLGYNSEGFTTLTIAGPTGEGLTSARTFTRQRRCVLVDGLRII